MSFLVSPPRWQPPTLKAHRGADKAASLLETAMPEEHTRYHDLPALQTTRRPDDLATSADSSLPRLATADSFSVTLPGQPAHRFAANAFGDADKGALPIILAPSLVSHSHCCWTGARLQAVVARLRCRYWFPPQSGGGKLDDECPCML